MFPKGVTWNAYALNMFWSSKDGVLHTVYKIILWCTGNKKVSILTGISEITITSHNTIRMEPDVLCLSFIDRSYNLLSVSPVVVIFIWCLISGYIKHYIGTHACSKVQYTPCLSPEHAECLLLFLWHISYFALPLCQQWTCRCLQDEESERSTNQKELNNYGVIRIFENT